MQSASLKRSLLAAALVGTLLFARPALAEDHALAGASGEGAAPAPEGTPSPQRGRFGALGSLYGQSVIGLGVQSSTGAALGLFYRRSDIAIVGQLRLADFGDADSFRGGAVQIGTRYYFFRGDVTPYIGAGLGLNGFVGRTTDVSLDGGGLSAHTTIGVQLFQTHAISIGASVQADLPFYSFTADPRNSRVGESSRWAVPIALGLDLILH